MTRISVTSKILTWAAIVLLAACTETPTEKYPSGYDRTETHNDIYAPRETIWKDGSPINKALNEHRMQKGQTGPNVNE